MALPFRIYQFYVYILTNKGKTVLYTGVTNELQQRLHFHRNHTPDSKSFTARYKCYYLIYFEEFDHILDAIAREKQIKGYTRKKKEALINAFNPSWDFLNDSV